MKPGNLVIITRNAIGVPAGTIALCLKRFQKRNAGVEIWSVQLVGGKYNGTKRRYFDSDLVVI